MRRAQPFRQRFVLLSVGLHAMPVLTFSVVFEVGPVSPPPSEKPMGVSLVYLEESATSAVAREDPPRNGADSDDDAKARRHAVEAAPRGAASRSDCDDSESGNMTEPEERIEVSSASVRTEASPSAAGRPPVYRQQVRQYLAGVMVDPGVGAGSEHGRRNDELSSLPEERLEVRQQDRVARPARRPPDDAAEPNHGRPLEVGRSRAGKQSLTQDREAVLEMIRRRIAKTMPLVFWDPTQRGQQLGRATVRFRMTRGGYVSAYELVRSSGDLEMDEAAHTVLHLAEPYVYVPGWIELALTFRG